MKETIRICFTWDSARSRKFTQNSESAKCIDSKFRMGMNIETNRKLRWFRWTRRLLLPGSGVLEVNRADHLKPIESTMTSLLDRKAEQSSEYVKIHVLKKIYVDFGNMKVSYQFLVQRQDGHGAMKDLSRRLLARTARFLAIHLSQLNLKSESIGFGRKIKQKDGCWEQALTTAHI